MEGGRGGERKEGKGVGKGRGGREWKGGPGEVGERGEWQGEESDMHGCRLKRGSGRERGEEEKSELKGGRRVRSI